MRWRASELVWNERGDVGGSVGVEGDFSIVLCVVSCALALTGRY